MNLDVRINYIQRMIIEYKFNIKRIFWNGGIYETYVKSSR